MATHAQCLVEAKYVEDTETTQYTSATGTFTTIDKCVAYSEAGGTITISIVGSGGTAGASNKVVEKTLAAKESYTFPEMVGQVLNPGDFVSADAAAASTVVFRLSGRKRTQ